jgi:primase-polymerase (primpol)-like protein
MITQPHTYTEAAKRDRSCEPLEYLGPLRIWACYRLEERESGKQGKVPYSAWKPDKKIVGKIGSSEQSKLLATYADALKALQEKSNRFDGLGFYIGPAVGLSVPIVFIDADNCLDDEGKIISPHIALYHRALDTYTKVSQSGKGLHWLLFGRLAEQARKVFKHEGLELYDEHFIVFTGKRYQDALATINERQQALDMVYSVLLDNYTRMEAANKTVPTVTKPGPEPQNESALPLDDEMLIRKAKQARGTGEFFTRFFENGDRAGFESASHADQRFFGMLAFWTGKNAEQMERIARASAMYRDKWDKHKTYVQRTIKTAIDNCTQIYTGTQKQWMIVKW